jgi:hypothetical protein
MKKVKKNFVNFLGEIEDNVAYKNAVMQQFIKVEQQEDNNV